MHRGALLFGFAERVADAFSGGIPGHRGAERDLSDTANAAKVVQAVKDRYGRIDVVSYQPLPGGTAFVPAAELDAERLSHWLNLFLLTPVAIAHSVLTEMTGGFIVTGGFTAADPQPFISGIGPAMAGIRNFVYSLHGEVADAGVYAGVVTLSALIKHSEAYHAMSPEQLAEITGGTTGIHVIDPADLAETYWRLFTDRDRTEYRFPDPAAH
ncbi:short-chain dehydrogenase [Streptomyces sp900116325]|uniref:short-chain dehydrogenase n=1 Tax=Streptomyces sp. 900116325 TaxID=3154295 RepID=UPI00339E574A